MKAIYVIILLSLLSTNLTKAQCTTPKEEGSWRNIDANTSSITQLRIKYICQDQVLNGVPCCPPGPPYKIHLYGKCEPSDCDWGEIGANRVENGWIFGTYDQGFAKRYVYTQMSPDQKTLYLWIETDFVDPNRQDYTSEDWFNKGTIQDPPCNPNPCAANACKPNDCGADCPANKIWCDCTNSCLIPRKCDELCAKNVLDATPSSIKKEKQVNSYMPHKLPIPLLPPKK